MNLNAARKEALKSFSRYIKLRDSPNGIGSCISCGKEVFYPNGSGEWHAGHYITRGSSPVQLWFDQLNCHGQCSVCNTFMGGNLDGFKNGLIDRYYPELPAELDSRRTMKFQKLYARDFIEIKQIYDKLALKRFKERVLDEI